MSVFGFLAVFVGAGVGALLRWTLGLWMNPWLPSLPLGTVAANLLGGLLVGVAVAHFTVHAELAPEWRLLVITGFMGGLTTFSTFSAEVVGMLARGAWAWAAGTVAVHLLGSLALTGLGLWAGHALASRSV